MSREQLSAIATVMRLFVEDDIAGGVLPRDSCHCVSCDAPRPAPGFIRYDDIHLCNACATDYEVHRAKGLALSLSGYLAQIRGRRGA